MLSQSFCLVLDFTNCPVQSQEAQIQVNNQGKVLNPDIREVIVRRINLQLTYELIVVHDTQTNA